MQKPLSQQVHLSTPWVYFLGKDAPSLPSPGLAAVQKHRYDPRLTDLLARAAAVRPSRGSASVGGGGYQEDCS